jgi:hypothetical protein
MNKNLTYTIGLCCIIVAGSVAYYFFSYLPSKNVLARQKECQTMALARFEKDQLNSPSGSLTQPEFVFDKQGRCLYKMHEVNTAGEKTFEMSYIIDLYTNKQVTGYNTRSDENGTVVVSGDQTEFESVDKKYFGTK